MNNITSLATVNGTDIRSSINGVAVRKAKKTGNLRLGVMQKKEYREFMVTQVNPKTGQKYTNAEANDSFPAYRAKTARDLTVKLANEMLANNITVGSVGSDAFHNLKSASFLQEKQAQRDRTTRAIEDAAAAFGISPSEAKALLEKRAKEVAAEAKTEGHAIEAETRSVATPTEGQPVATS